MEESTHSEPGSNAITSQRQEQLQEQQQGQSTEGIQGTTGMSTQGPREINFNWSLVKDFSRPTSKSWASPGSRRKFISHQGSSVATTALTHIYSSPSHVMPATSEGIVVQALSLMSDSPATGNTERNLKKISKRRRKANGQVDVEHTKSNNEFLRKIQQSLRESQEDSGSSSEEEERPESSSDASSHTCASKRTSITYNSDTSHRSSWSSLKPGETLSNPYGYEDPDKAIAPSNPYGYEDPDKAIVLSSTNQERSIPFIARRRGSVTEHTIRAAAKAAALAIAEGDQKMQVSHISTGGKGGVMSRKVDALAMASAAAQRLQNIQGTSSKTLNFFQSRLHRGQMAMESSSASSSSFAKPFQLTSSSALERNPYGSDDVDLPINDATASIRGSESTASNPYGYGDPDVRPSLPDVSDDTYGYEDPDASTGNRYGYGDEAPRANRPTDRPRPRRRGSVTKYSLGAAASVAAANEDANQDDTFATDEYIPVIPAQQDRIMSPKYGLRQPTRKLSPWQIETSTLGARKAALSRAAAIPGAPTVHVPPSRTSSHSESFRTNHSHDMPDSSDDDGSIASSSSDELSLEDSFASLEIPLKDGTSSDRDGPFRPPARHDSNRSFASRDSTNYSVRTYDSDGGDSLAPDMKSLCSISQHDRFSSNGPTSASIPPPPIMLPHTPPPKSRSLKFRSPQMTKSGQVKGARPVARQRSGDVVVQPMMTFVETSPLPSPKMSNRGPYSREKMIYQPDMLNEAKLDL